LEKLESEEVLFQYLKITPNLAYAGAMVNNIEFAVIQFSRKVVGLRSGRSSQAAPLSILTR
jgi:hypothetical protein